MPVPKNHTITKKGKAIIFLVFLNAVTFVVFLSAMITNLNLKTTYYSKATEEREQNAPNILIPTNTIAPLPSELNSPSNCSQYFPQNQAPKVRIDSISPEFQDGRVSFTIKGFFPDLGNCGWQSDKQEKPRPYPFLAVLERYPKQMYHEKDYFLPKLPEGFSPRNNLYIQQYYQVKSADENTIILDSADAKEYSNEEWIFWLSYCKGNKVLWGQCVQTNDISKIITISNPYLPSPIPSPTLTIVTLLPTLTKPAAPASSQIAQTVQCSDLGLSRYDPQPKHMTREMCSDTSIPYGYDDTYVPQDLVNLKDTLGNDYPIWSYLAKDTKLVTIDGIKGLLNYLKEEYKKDRNKCLPIITAGYRSYEMAQDIYKSNNCVWDPETRWSVVKDASGNVPKNINDRVWCGAARPQFDPHRDGIAYDLYCAKVECDNTNNNCAISVDFNKNVINYLNDEIMKKNGFLHPIGVDPPHFIYYL